MRRQLLRDSIPHSQLMLHELHEFDVGDVYVLVYLKPVSDKLCTGDRLFIIDHLLNGALDD